MKDPLATYLKRFPTHAQILELEPDPALSWIVAIPTRNEPALADTLRSLVENDAPISPVEVIVCFNTAPDDPEEIHSLHEYQLEQFGSRTQLASWIGAEIPSWINIFAIQAPEWTRKVAGVGSARKLVMDEALRRFHRINRPEGWILCLDADCVCDRRYFKSIESAIQANPEATGAHAFFEHSVPHDLPESSRSARAIQLYEIGLRYYRLALKWSGFRHAVHTVGSCMMARADAYARMGGMNRRQAGEDFYFVHKLALAGPMIYITDCLVYPSPRISNRVPFGTGKAVGSMLAKDEVQWQVEPFQAFVDLKQWFAMAESLFQDLEENSTATNLQSKAALSQELIQSFLDHAEEKAKTLPPGILKFLEQRQWLEEFKRIILGSATKDTERWMRAFFDWFNGFLCMKYLRFAEAEIYGPQLVETAVSETLAAYGQPGASADVDIDLKSLSAQIKALDATSA